MTSAEYFVGGRAAAAWSANDSPVVEQPATSTSMAQRASALRSKLGHPLKPSAIAACVPFMMLPADDFALISD